ncbi:MAG: inverse autotransporter beta domain-containing protein [Candidatus Symbiodolus clandestinus]
MTTLTACQKQDYLLTAGIHYTPVPLLTLYYRHQRIHSQQTNHQYGITLIYRVNSSLKKQLAPT